MLAVVWAGGPPKTAKWVYTRFWACFWPQNPIFPLEPLKRPSPPPNFPLDPIFLQKLPKYQSEVRQEARSEVVVSDHGALGWCDGKNFNDFFH